MAEEKIYTATDLSRYHSGRMSAAEMHELEKAALADPFLADALEGYAYAETPEKDMALLAQQITEKQSRRKVFFLLPRADNGWLRIAAILIVFAGAAYTFYRFNEHKQEPSLASNEIKNPVPADTSAKMPVAGSTVSTGTLAAKETQKKEPVTSANIQTNSASASYYTTTTPAASSATMPSGYQTEKLFSATDSVTPGLNGIAAADQTKSLKPVTKSPADDKREVSANGNIAMDADAKFKTTAPVVNATPASRDIAQNNTKQGNVEQDKISPAKDEERNISAESAANAKENRALLRKGVSEKPPTSQLHGKMEPIDSVVFIDYTVKNIKPIYRADSSEFEGKVILSFTVNKKGQAENIKVEKPVCKVCDEQAISMLKNGPHWIYVAGKKREVAVEYKATESASDQ